MKLLKPLVIGLLGALLALALYAALPGTIPAPSIPPDMRIWTSVNQNGTFDSSGKGTFVQEPYLDLVVIACTPILAANGQPQLTAYGTPAYKDSGWVGELKLPISQLSASELATLAPIWQQATAAEYQVLQNHPGQIAWHQMQAPPAAQ